MVKELSVSSKNAVEVHDVRKTFHLPHENHSGIKQLLLGLSRRNKKKGFETQEVLKGVSFEIKEGDFFGIVGRNGSGKSTLLKTIAGIYTPDEGEVSLKGKLVPFIELGVGFNPELTGRENVFLNGALLGFSREEMYEMYDDIVDFAELDRFMDQKLKNYSSGMQVRLAFSIAIRAQGDILLLDEVLAVGDARFQQKCYDYFFDLKEEGKTVIFISHDMDAVQKFCNSAVYLRDGKIVKAGKPIDITENYLEDLYGTQNNRKKENKITKESPVKNLALKVKSQGPYTVDSVLDLEFSYENNSKIPTEVRMAIVKDGIAIAHINSKEAGAFEGSGHHKATLQVNLADFLGGNHEINWGVYNTNTGERLAFLDRSESFFVKHTDNTRSGFFSIDGTWKR